MEDDEPEIVPNFTMQQLLVDVWSSPSSSLTFINGKGLGKSIATFVNLMKNCNALGVHHEPDIETLQKILVSHPIRIAAERSFQFYKRFDFAADIDLQTGNDMAGTDGGSFINHHKLYKWMQQNQTIKDASGLWPYRVVIIDDYHVQGLVQDLMQQLIPHIIRQRDGSSRPIHFILQSPHHPNQETLDLMTTMNGKVIVQDVNGTLPCQREIRFEPPDSSLTRVGAVRMKIDQIVDEAEKNQTLSTLGIIVFLPDPNELKSKMIPEWRHSLYKDKVNIVTVCEDGELEITTWRPLVIFATDILANGIILPNIDRVIVTGMRTLDIFVFRLGEAFPQNIVLSQVEVDQQCRRVGRMMTDGVCHLLFSKEAYEALPENPVQVSAVGNCMDYMFHLLSLNVSGLPLKEIDTQHSSYPPREVVALAVLRLQQTGCIHCDEPGEYSFLQELQELYLSNFPSIDLRLANAIYQLRTGDHPSRRIILVTLACIIHVKDLYIRRSRLFPAPAEVAETQEGDWPDALAIGDPWAELIQFERCRRLGVEIAGTGQKHWITSQESFRRIKSLRDQILENMGLDETTVAAPLGPTNGDVRRVQELMYKAFKFQLVKITHSKKAKALERKQKIFDELRGIHLASGVEINLSTRTILETDKHEEGLYVVYFEMASGQKGPICKQLLRVPKEFVESEFGVGATVEDIHSHLDHHIRPPAA